MSKNKLKFVIFIFAFLSFLVFKSDFVLANDYTISIESVDNLVYGNKLKDGYINGKSSISGEFSFYKQENVINSVGETEIEIIFTPDDLENYETKKVNFVANVEKRKIFVIFEAPIYKQHDGGTGVNLPCFSYGGIINNEVNVAGTLVGNFSATYVGEDIPIVLSGITIEGEKSEYYYVDLLEHSGRIYPSKLEKGGENATIINLDKGVYVDVGYSLKVSKEDYNTSICNDMYTSFLKYSYIVYNHNGVKMDVDGNFKVQMSISQEIMNTERIKLFELTSDGEYKKLDYSYIDGEIRFSIASQSELVICARNIEYKFIFLFSAILLFSLIFVIVYRWKNSRIKEYKEY